MTDWWEKVKYEAIVEKWREEALCWGEAGDLEYPWRKLTLSW